MILTASAPPAVESELVRSLHLEFLLCKMNRYYSQLWHIGLAEQLKSIMFATTKTLTMQVYSFLSQCARFKHYVGVCHTSLTKETKDLVYRNFVTRYSEMQCLCATIAFGLNCSVTMIVVRLIILGKGKREHQRTPHFSDKCRKNAQRNYTPGYFKCV